MIFNDVFIFVRDILLSEKYIKSEISYDIRNLMKKKNQIIHFLETEYNYEMITLLESDNSFIEIVFKDKIIIEYNNNLSYDIIYKLDLSINDILNFDDDILVNTIKLGRIIAEEIKSDAFISTINLSKPFFYGDV